MPIYEYQCEKCGHQLEALQKISDSPLTDCPACHQAALQKLVSAASFRLKGGGWYETDFKTGDKKQLADSGGADGESTKGSDSGSSGQSKSSEAKSSDSPKSEGKTTESSSASKSPTKRESS